MARGICCWIAPPGLGRLLNPPEHWPALKSQIRTATTETQAVDLPFYKW
jgi:hypothetical protein